MDEPLNGQRMVDQLESQLRLRSTLLTMPGLGECLACYVLRMLNFGCQDLGWALRFRDQTAPRATALERNLEAMGAYCDCEIFLNAYEPNPAFFGRLQDQDQVQAGDPDQVPDQIQGQNGGGDVLELRMPPCLGVRQGSVKPCLLWVRMRRFY